MADTARNLFHDACERVLNEHVRQLTAEQAQFYHQLFPGPLNHDRMITALDLVLRTLAKGPRDGYG